MKATLMPCIRIMAGGCMPLAVPAHTFIVTWFGTMLKKPGTAPVMDQGLISMGRY
jgi:hypothetical protein